MVTRSQVRRGCAKPVVQHGGFSTFSPSSIGSSLAFQPPEPEPGGGRVAVVNNPGHTTRRPPFITQAEIHSGRSLQGDSSDTCAIAIANANDKCVGTVTLRSSPPAPPSMLCDNTCLNPFGNGSKFINNGHCQDGYVGSDGALCDLGTDCDDCGPRDYLPPSPPPPSPPSAPTLCTNECLAHSSGRGGPFANNSFCQDGADDPRVTGTTCAYGTDCTDCGPRFMLLPSHKK